MDGTYDEGPIAGDPFARTEGIILYEIYRFSNSDTAGWYIAVDNGVVYRVSGAWRFVESCCPAAEVAFETPVFQSGDSSSQTLHALGNVR